MRANTWAVLLLLAGGAVGTQACRAQQAETAPSPYDLTGSIEDIMVGMVEPGADTIFESASVRITAAGMEEHVPTTDEDWARIEHAALMLAEAANLLRMPGRVVAGANRRPPQSDAVPELTPEQIQQKIDADRAAWVRHSAALIEQARRALEYARARDVKGLFDVGGPLDEACENCHLVYWYPNAPKPPGE